MLDHASPSVVLNRVQSGVGMLTLQAHWPPAYGFWLGCAFQLRSGRSSVLRQHGPERAEAGPLRLSTTGGVQRLDIDLLRGLDLQRLIVFGMLGMAPPGHWRGTMTVTTFGGARIDVPVPRLAPAITVLVSIFNVEGEYVLRAEMEHVNGSISQACQAFGFGRIVWRDRDTPVS